MTGSHQIEQADITNVRTYEHVIDPAKMKATGYMMFFCAWISFSAWISMFDLGIRRYRPDHAFVQQSVWPLWHGPKP